MEEEAKANKRICGRHNKEYEFICTNSECKGRLLCGECILEHDTHKTKLITEYMNSEQEEIKNSLGFPNEENLSSKFQIMNSKSAITAKLILKMRGEMEASYKHLLLSIQKEIEEQMNRKIGEIDVILGNIDQYHEICSQSTTIQQEITFITSQISCKNYDLLSSSIVNLQLLKSLLHSNIINANFDLDINWDQIWKKEMHKMVNSKEVLIDGKAIKKIQIEVEKEFKMASSFVYIYIYIYIY